MSYNNYTDKSLGKFMLIMKEKLGDEKYQIEKQNLENMYTSLDTYLKSFSWNEYEFIEEDRDLYLKSFFQSILKQND